MLRTPFGVLALAAFFVFGAIMSLLACAGLLLPGGALEPIWRLNPQSHEALSRMGYWAIGLMACVSLACALAARGLLKLAAWGRQLAIGVLAVNLIGDSANAIFRDDLRTLIGLPIGALLIAYLLRPRVKRAFTGKRESG